MGKQAEPAGGQQDGGLCIASVRDCWIDRSRSDHTRCPARYTYMMCLYLRSLAELYMEIIDWAQSRGGYMAYACQPGRAGCGRTRQAAGRTTTTLLAASPCM
jgi:hypothetical protein